MDNIIFHNHQTILTTKSLLIKRSNAFTCVYILMCLHFTGTMGFGLMPQIKSESPWGLSHLTSAYTSAHLAAHVAAATSGGGVGAYGSPNNETSLHHISSSPSGNHHQQQQHSSALQDLQNPMSAASTGSPLQHQQ